MEGDHGEYYRNSLKYLGVSDLSKMSQSDQQAKAFSLGISALLASVSIILLYCSISTLVLLESSSKEVSLECLQYGRTSTARNFGFLEGIK